MPQTKSKTTAKSAPIKKKPIVKKTKTVRKAKTVIVDIINDEENIFAPEEIKAEEDSFPEFPVFAEKTQKKNISKRADSKESLINTEIDQQKRFFSSLAAEAETKKKTSPKKQVSSRKSLGLYKRLVFRFILLTTFLVLVVAYFSFSKLTISIVPKGEIVNDTLFLRVYKEGAVEEVNRIDFSEKIAGEVKEVDARVEKEYFSSGEEFIGEEIQGRVKIINNYSRNQPLVATTRILSPDNKLYRIKNAVDVPSGGEVEVEIYTNEARADMAVGLTTFTIPGLWAGLQDKIYAKNDKDFVFTQKIKKYIKASDISRANQDINDLLLTNVMKGDGSSSDWLYKIAGAIKTNIDVEVGEEKDSFMVSAEGKIIAVSFSKEEAGKLAMAKLSLFIPDDKELIEFDKNNISYSLDSYDAEKGVATVKAIFRGTISLKTDTNVIDKRQLVNLNVKQLEEYLNNFQEIKEYSFNFFPSFIQKAPRLPERIQIDVQSLNDR